jgi:hypothetical protein
MFPRRFLSGSLYPVEGARPRLNVQVKASVIDVETRLMDNGKKVRQEVLLEIFVKVTEIQQNRSCNRCKRRPQGSEGRKEALEGR